MNEEALAAARALNQRFLLDYPHEAARRLESASPREIGHLLAMQPPHAVVRAWQLLAPDIARAVVEHLPESLVRHLLSESEPASSAAITSFPSRREKT